MDDSGERRTLSRAEGSTEVALLEDTIDANFRHTVATWPDREALVVRHQAIRWTYRQLDGKVDELARGLLSLGLDPGDRLALWSPNRYEWVLLQYATARIGVIMVCINPAYRTSELAFALRHSGSRILFAASQFKTSNYFEMRAEICPEIATAKEGWAGGAK